MKSEKLEGFLCYIKESGFYFVGNRELIRVLGLRSKWVSFVLRRIVLEVACRVEWRGEITKEG